MNQKLRNFFSFFGKQGPRQMLMSAVIFLAIFSILPICGAESFPGTCAVTNNNDSGPGSLRQCVLDAENGSVITFSDDYIITLDSEIIIGKDLTVDAEGFAVTLQADAMPGVAGHGLLTVSEDAAVTVRNMTLRHGRGTMASAAVQSDGTLTLEDCTVTGNHALYAYDYPGIANTGTLTLIRSVLSDHADGRAVIVNTGPAAVLTVRDSTFRDNGIPGIMNTEMAVRPACQDARSSATTPPAAAPVSRCGTAAEPLPRTTARSAGTALPTNTAVRPCILPIRGTRSLSSPAARLSGTRHPALTADLP